MTEIDPEIRPLSRLMSLAHEVASKPAAPEVQGRGRARILSNVAARRQPKSLRLTRHIQRGIGVGACGLAVAVAVWFLRPRSLSYEVRGGSALESPYVGARADTPAEIMFSDGSQVRADPGTRLRIGDTHSDGARIFVERGVANAQVVHRQHSSWLFAAGPFEVRVTGTKLTISWDPVKEELDLTLHEGSVEVRSPIGQQPISVRAGERFFAKAEASKQWTGQVVRSVSASAASVESVPAEPRVEFSTSHETPNAQGQVQTTDAPAANANVARGRTPTPHRDSWQSLVMRGEFEAVITAAAARGSHACLESCTAVDLRAFADAARYTKRFELAEKCLLALRQRFSGSSASAGAAFLLGRTSESRGRNAQAEHWYELYLAESSDGEFASDALAGCMRVVAALRGKSAARSLAVEYLRRYPDGVYSSSARGIAPGPN